MERRTGVERRGGNHLKEQNGGEEKAKQVTVVPFPCCLKSALKIGNSGVS